MDSGLSISKVISLYCVLIGCADARHVYRNAGDQKASFECNNGQYLYRITSEHDNATNDRVWEYDCTGSGATAYCMWSGYENAFGQPLAFHCPGARVVTGMISEFDKKSQDRRFKFKCCSVPGKPTYDCHVEPWASYWGEYMNFVAPHKYIIKGAFSYHDDESEDRRWRFVVCAM